ncbi:MAG: carboxypeptidase-like regulatory domain-containing protein, partial [Planctomycetota bacterium]
GGVVHGQVLDAEGHPASGAKVELHSPEEDPPYGFGILGVEHQTRTDESGAYELCGIVRSGLELSSESASSLPRAVSQVRLETLAAGERRRVDLRLSEDPVIAGVVVDESGLPIPDVCVRAKQRSGPYYDRWVTTDAGGRFRLTAVNSRPSGLDTWTIKATAENHKGNRELGFVQGVKLGSEDVRMVAERPGLPDAFLRGRVIGGGEPLPANLEVAIYPVYARTRRINSGQFLEVDPRTGAFQCGPVIAGKYRIVAMQTDAVLGTIEAIEVKAGETLVLPDLKLSTDQAAAGSAK